ncbi:MAG TPA: lamin tail domain-containing protein, partial [Verrucomicrobia bacterium]|nr:lamin tail domain-containing protein [Verrucomicrobiota bacterium]
SLKYPNVEVTGVYKGKLNNGGERLTLSHAVGTIIETTRFQDALPWPSSPDGKGFSLVHVSSSANSDPENPTAWRASSLIGGSPGFDDPTTNLVPVLINEILTHTDLPVVDAVELFNPNAEPADISHWYLSDDRNTPKKFRIPQGTIVPPEAFRVFDEFDFNQNPGTDGSFSLSSHGEEVFLFSADDSGNLTGYSHGFTFPAGENAVTFGRHVISTGRVHFPPLSRNTLGGPNSEPKVGPVVLNEIHYHPSPSDEEFIELKNISHDSIPLFDPAFPENLWKFSGIDFDFPADVTLPPKGLIVITSTEPELFRTKFSISESIQIFGPFAGSLQNGGERLQLTRPDTPDVDDQGNSVVPYLLVDQVRYDNNSPWPLEPGGQGPSLERIQPSEYGNEPLNWRASLGDPSPGRNNDGNRLPLVDAGDDQSAVAGLFPAPLAIVGTAQDDGMPKPPNRLLTRWQQVSGPGPVRFENQNDLSTTAFFPGTGDYILSLTAEDGELQANDTVSIQFTRPAADADFITVGSEWKYLANGSNQNTAWRNLSFNDSSWKSGAAQLGYGDGDEATTLSFGPNGNSKFITTYFRKTFMILNRSAVQEMMLRLVRDDGAVIYLNGNEVFRSNMPSGTIGFQTMASAVAGGADESTFFESPIDPARLRNGVNLLAVEIHQANLSSSDISFDLVLGGTVTEVNHAPEVVAGNDRTVNVEDQLNLGGSWTDDGLPEAQSVPSILWTMVTGPGAVQFNPEDALETTARFSEPGIYTLRLTVTDGALTGSDDLRVTAEGDTGPFSEWLTQHFTASEIEQVDIVGRNADPDLDHQTNFEEFIAGTDPKNPESLLEFREVTVKTGDSESVHLRFFAVEGKTYTIEFTDDLNGDPWQGMSNVGPLPVSGWLTLKAPFGVQLNRYYRIATPKHE